LSEITQPNDFFSIVVLGAMNPSIHHPAWYRLMRILTEEESERAERSGTILATPQISQFSGDSITVVCEPGRWQVQTRDEAQLQRLREIAEETFKILYHTPVSAFGFNFAHHRKTSLSRVNTTLANLVEALPLGLKPNGAERRAAKFNYSTAVDERVLTIAIEPSSKGEELVYVAINAEHRIPIPPPGELRQFDLTPLLKENFPRDYEDAKRNLASVLDSLNALKEG
jgi:hypothetical protein